MNKKVYFVLGMFFLFGIFLISLSSSVEVNNCCERTIDGAVCQSVEASNCDSNYLSSPTSCEQTSFCSTGTCIDTKEGLCLEGYTQKTCEDSINGYFDEREIEDIPQCQIGCCIYGGDSAPTTQTRCSALASEYGYEVEYRSDITDQLECLAMTGGEEEGACVYEKNGILDCERLTKSECNNLESSSTISNVIFNEGYLCSADFLGVACGPSEKTTCLSDESGVYFLDTCGNKANIYDSSKVDDKTYWTKIIPLEDSCGYGESNADSPSCGNCEILAGSVCAEYVRGENEKPDYGNYVCEDLGCVYKGEEYNHGDKWCEETNPLKELIGMSEIENSILGYLPGTESYILSCYNGEVIINSCSTGEFRNKICKESTIQNNAECEVNIWRDCIDQTTQESCENDQLRDCLWLEGRSLYVDEEGNSIAENSEGDFVEASCVPKYPPAGKFWTDEEDGEQTTTLACEAASDACLVEFEFGVSREIFGGIFGGSRNDLADEYEEFKECKEDGKEDCDTPNIYKFCSKNCQCLIDYEKGMSKINERENFEKENKEDNYLLNYEDWKNVRDNMCFAMGDCGYSTNAFGYEGYYDENDLIVSEFYKKAKDFREEQE